MGRKGEDGKEDWGTKAYEVKGKEWKIITEARLKPGSVLGALCQVLLLVKSWDLTTGYGNGGQEKQCTWSGGNESLI